MEGGGSTEEDVEALRALYGATGGRDWKIPWKMEDAANTWPGVRWEKGRVVELDLGSNELQGTRPLPSQCTLSAYPHGVRCSASV